QQYKYTLLGPLSPARGSISSCLEWLKFIWNLNGYGVNSAKVLLYVSIAMDHIWMIRNLVVHDKHDIAACLRSISSSYSIFSEGLLPPPTSSRMNEWLTPPEGWVKVNFDIAMGSNAMMLASVARDHNG
ncbi:hypothetical protein TorRG33x02_049050, partial [Trema orientale]